MNPTEIKATGIIGTILAARLLGIFLILPVFSSYALLYPGSSHFLAGIAFGIYALTQAVLQIPFGRASDRFGRKPVIIAGLVLFCAGSVACGLADSIWELIAARAIQGSGAVGSVAIAALGDFTRPEVRGQSFAAVGIIIGAAFIAATAAGPAVAAWLGFETVFYILAAMGAAAMATTILLFPGAKGQPETGKTVGLMTALRKADIRKIMASAFILSTALNIFLFVYPLNWQDAGGDISRIWKAYLIVLLPSAVLSYPFLKAMERRKTMNIPGMAAFALLAAGVATIAFGGGKTGMIVAGAMFFLGHSIFQPLLPAFLTQATPGESRGSAAGFLNLSTFLGAFAGSLAGGVFYAAGARAALMACLALVVAWAAVGIPKAPRAGGETERT
ncbi:MAG: MFS transporter [Candidatus Dadabacteria bacterium]|nr:MFS transporter [Candidatus Dadabacteria bacterium]